MKWNVSYVAKILLVLTKKQGYKEINLKENLV